MSLNQRFNVGRRLGSGSFANVFLVTRKKDGKKYALKKVKLVNMSKKGSSQHPFFVPNIS